MSKYLKILGNGQIWDLKGISFSSPQKTFEDLFSGRALAQMADQVNQQSLKTRKVFSRFKERGKITGLSVTKALLSNNQQARDTALVLFERLAKNAAAGIEALTEGRGFKPNWTNQQRSCWKNLNTIIIGGGVSEGTTGKVLVRLIKKYLSKKGGLRLKIYQAKFSGKEAGFLGAVINIRELICKQAKQKGSKGIAVIGLDLGREEIGIGLLAINPKSGKIISKRSKCPWFFQHSVKTPHPQDLKAFLDSRQNYTKKERAKGEHIRSLILKQIANLINLAQAKAQKLRRECSRNIAVAVPGCTSGGYIINSTDFLPFFRKQDGFYFSRALEELLVKRGTRGYRIHIINDGIAAGIANAYFDASPARTGKLAFFGVGSGLGGCVGQMSIR